MDSLSISQARRIALAAQGFADRPHRQLTMRSLERTIRRTGVFQVDSVNVVVRAHEMPLFSRLGDYPRELLTRATSQAPRRLVEYWAHAQALMPVDLWPVMQHRMRGYREHRHRWWAEVTDDTTHRLLEHIRQQGPSTARQLAEDPFAIRSREHWGWNWSEERTALAYLAMVGDLVVAGRNGQFEVLYDLPERALPQEVLSAPTLSAEEAHVELVRRAARSHGVATINCLADYYRLGLADTKRALATLLELGEVSAVKVEGWDRPTWRSQEVAIPQRLRSRALLAPFDPVVWERRRLEELFAFRYRIEIYVPARQRVHGYYVFPFLLGEQIVARVDLKADRRNRVLRVQAAWGEEGAPAETAEELAAELRMLAGWQGLDEIEVVERGDLWQALRLAVASTG